MEARLKVIQVGLRAALDPKTSELNAVLAHSAEAGKQLINELQTKYEYAQEGVLIKLADLITELGPGYALYLAKAGNQDWLVETDGERAAKLSAFISSLEEFKKTHDVLAIIKNANAKQKDLLDALMICYPYKAECFVGYTAEQRYRMLQILAGEVLLEPSEQVATMGRVADQKMELWSMYMASENAKKFDFEHGFHNPLDKIGIIDNDSVDSPDDDKIAFAPALYLFRLQAKKQQGDQIKAAAALASIYGGVSGVKLIVSGSTALLQNIGYAEVGNLLLNSVFSSDPVRGELSGSHWGKSFFETWAIVSTSVDVATVGVSFRNSYKEVEHVIDPRLSLQGKKRLEGIVAGVGKEAPTIYKNVKYDDFISTVGDFANGAKKELADEAYKLWGEEKWEELYKLFNPSNGPPINGGWPPYNGAVNTVKRSLNPADFNHNLIVDRYGPPTGTFVSPGNTPLAQRALPSNFANEPPLRYKIVKSIDNVEEGRIAPWFDQPGMGLQYKLEKPVQYYVEKGDIIQIK